eukprot:6130800-Amphidinium_carterae.1
MDASIGGTLYINGSLQAALSSQLLEEDFKIHGFSKGDAQEQQTWESLSSRRWRSALQDPTATWTVMTAINMIVNLTSKGEGPATVAR